MEIQRAEHPAHALAPVIAPGYNQGTNNGQENKPYLGLLHEYRHNTQCKSGHQQKQIHQILPLQHTYNFLHKKTPFRHFFYDTTFPSNMQGLKRNACFFAGIWYNYFV